MLKAWTICCAVLMTVAMSGFAAEKKAPRAPFGKSETLACRLGTEDRHARIAVVLTGGKVTEFAYYSKWKPRTCSIYLQRNRDSYSTWADNGNLTTINVARGAFLIEHGKGQYRFVFRDIDRERYCGMDGRINGSLTIRKGSDACELEGASWKRGRRSGRPTRGRTRRSRPAPTPRAHRAGPATAPVNRVRNPGAAHAQSCIRPAVEPGSSRKPG